MRSLGPALLTAAADLAAAGNVSNLMSGRN
jgi:hypothetical protein